MAGGKASAMCRLLAEDRTCYDLVGTLSVSNGFRQVGAQPRNSRRRSAEYDRPEAPASGHAEHRGRQDYDGEPEGEEQSGERCEECGSTRRNLIQRAVDAFIPLGCVGSHQERSSNEEEAAASEKNAGCSYWQGPDVVSWARAPAYPALADHLRLRTRRESSVQLLGEREADCPSCKRSDDGISRVVDSGMDTGVGDGGGEHPHGKRQCRDLVPDCGSECESRGGVAGGEGRRIRHSSVAGADDCRGVTVRTLSRIEVLKSYVDHGRGGGDGHESGNGGPPAASSANNPQSSRQRHPYHGVVCGVGQASQWSVEGRGGYGCNSLVNGLVDPSEIVQHPVKQRPAMCGTTVDEIIKQVLDGMWRSRSRPFVGHESHLCTQRSPLPRHLSKAGRRPPELG
jgi:hypothetical protein